MTQFIYLSRNAIILAGGGRNLLHKKYGKKKYGGGYKKYGGYNKYGGGYKKYKGYHL